MISLPKHLWRQSFFLGLHVAELAAVTEALGVGLPPLLGLVKKNALRQHKLLLERVGLVAADQRVLQVAVFLDFLLLDIAFVFTFTQVLETRVSLSAIHFIKL